MYRRILITSTIILMLLTMFSPVQAETKTLSVKSSDGVPIVYTDQGQGDIALVFVHCWCCNKGFWDAQVPYFAKKYRVITLDLAGHGESGQERNEYTIQAYGQDVAVVINELKLNKVILVGHSMGGPVSVAAALLIPGKVIGLIAVDTLPDLEMKITDEQAAGYMAPLEKNFAEGTRHFLSAFMFTPKSNPELKEKIISSMSSSPSKVGLESMKSMFKQNLAKMVEDAKIHIRCIDAEMNPANLEAGKRHALSYEVKTMKDVGHFLHMENPEEFNKLMDEAINSLTKNLTTLRRPGALLKNRP